MEETKRFIERIKTDESLRSALEELERRKADLDEVIALAKGHGFAITKEDWETAAKEVIPVGELSEEQLAAVSGGRIKFDFSKPPQSL